MKFFASFMILLLYWLSGRGQDHPSLTYHKVFTLDSISLLRNPAMGWILYEEGVDFLENSEKNNPERFWKMMDSVHASDYANILYVRVPWKVMEPEEGKYAWKYNKEYQAFIQKAEDRGLKLAFRIFFDNGTPDWVYKAGCHSTLDPPMNLKGDKQPYYDDPVFLAELKKFIKAFAKEYDDPSRVDFVDAYGLGRWGEGHGVTLKDQDNYKMVIEKVTGYYARYFKNILLVYNLSRSDWHFSKPLVYDKLGFIPRRDGIGSHWFDDTERKYMKALFPDKPLIGEGCYWFGNGNRDTSYHTKKAFLNDPRFPDMKYWTDALSVAVEDAIKSRSNTFDLRTPFESKVWIEELPQKVQKFITYGGYRLYPDSISIHQTNRTFNIDHFWRNFGVGVLPNSNPNWDDKYKVCFALLDPQSGVPKYTVIDSIANPGTWIKGDLYGYYSLNFQVPGSITSGTYILAVGLIDSTTGKIGIHLSLKQKQLFHGWAVIRNCVIR